MADKETMPRPELPPGVVEPVKESPERSGGFEVSETPAMKDKPQPQPIPTAQAPATPATPVTPKDEVTQKVEAVLEDGLKETYRELDEPTRKKFRTEGERVVWEIAKMMKRLNVRARKVLHLIRGWLRIIPHINRHFLDQEAKIKTDKIMHLAEDEKDELI